MMKLNKLAMTGLAGLMAISLSGCIVVSERGWSEGEAQYDHQQVERDNRQMISNLTMNARLDDVRTRMGTPDFNERWSENGDDYQVLFYRTQRLHADGLTTKDECTPIVFVNGELAGTGQVALDKVM
ncbi:DUF3192 domain-containing protein [Idiomarina fontislapidosi]|nr:DUF3192 domain-containing protein [Idiomarina fontislapidosi]|tara:strand:- start:3882 stop:4262 length:381 start_codon:yes stop_codon:yes gene_type:complete